MNILTIKTDGPETYLGLYNDGTVMGEKTWESGRELARHLLPEITLLMQGHGLGVSDINGIVCYSGPGSFTSLRIGITTANTFAYLRSIPIVGVTGENWIQEGTCNLLAGINQRIVLPHYGSEPHITQVRK